MLEREALLAGREILQAEDFYRPAHQAIYAALAALSEGTEPVDLITLQDELRRREKLSDCGGTEYLMALVNSVPTAANIEHYARIVARCAEARKVIAACTSVVAACYDPEIENAGDLLVTTALGLHRRQDVALRPIADVVHDAWADLEREGKGDKREGIPFGVPALVRLCYGVEPGEAEFDLIAGRPSSGKTILLNEIAVNAAERGIPVIYFSQETSAKKLVRRMIFSRCGVDPYRFRHRQWASEEEGSAAWDAIAHATAEIHALESRILICDRTLPISRLIAAARRAILRNGNGPSVVLVDYLQIVGVDTSKARWYENRNVEVQEICRQLKSLSQECGIPVVAATQINRPPKGTRDYVPTMADLREGGNQEAEADKIIIVHNPTVEGKESDYADPADKSQPRPVTFRVAKHKDGPTGDVGGWFTPGRFHPRDEYHPEPTEAEMRSYRNPFTW